MKTNVTTIKRHFTTSVTDLEMVQEFLEEMALEGWMLKSVSSATYVFEKCEPKKVKFCVDFFNGTDSKNQKSYTYQRRKEYIALCEDAGWKYIAVGKNSGLMFFCTEDMNLAPIKLDDNDKFKGICRYFILRNGGVFCCGMSIVALLILAMLIINNIVSGEMLYSILCDLDFHYSYLNTYLIVILFGGSASIVKFILFYRKNKKSVVAGEEISYLGKKEDRIVRNVKIVVESIWISILLIFIGNESTIFGLFISLFALTMCILGIVTSVKEFNRFKHIEVQYYSLIGAIKEMAILTVCVLVAIMLPLAYKHSKDMLLPAEPQLAITDLGVDIGKYTDMDEYDRSRITLFSDTKSFLIEHYTDDDEGDYGFDLKYEVMNSKYDIAIDTYKEHMLKEYSSQYSKANDFDIQKWGANEVYYLDDIKNDVNGIMVIYDDKVVFINTDYDKKIDYTGTYAETICQKLDIN